MTFYRKIRGPQRMNPNDLSDPLTFPVVPPGGQSFHLTSETSKHLFQELASNFNQHSRFPVDHFHIFSAIMTKYGKMLAKPQLFLFMNANYEQ